MTRTLETHGAAFATRVEAVADPHTLVQIGDALDNQKGRIYLYRAIHDAYPIAVRPHAAARP